MKLSPHRLTRVQAVCGIRSLSKLGNWQSAPDLSRALPPPQISRGCTSMHFGENQLSPGSISFSLLSTALPPVLQHGWVRASTDCHIRFTLAMDSSPGFGSHQRHANAPFGLGFPAAPQL